MSTDPAARLLAPGEPAAFEIVNPDGAGRAVLVCDHASRRIPRRLGTLGVDPGKLSRHIAWDIGAAAVTRRLAVTLEAPGLERLAPPAPDVREWRFQQGECPP